MSRFDAGALVLLLSFVGATCDPATGQESPQVVASRTAREARSSLEQQTFALINQYREAEHLAPLHWNADIAREARAHSQDMATGKVDFGHEGFKDRISALKKLISGIDGAGENVFETDDPEQVASSAVGHWLGSPPHLQNIRGDYNYSGIGLSEGEGGRIYFTQLFVKVAPASTSDQTKPPARSPFERWGAPMVPQGR